MKEEVLPCRYRHEPDNRKVEKIIPSGRKKTRKWECYHCYLIAKSPYAGTWDALQGRGA